MSRSRITTVLLGLLLGPLLAAAPASPAVAITAHYGKTAAPDRALKPSCHNYRYRYVIKAPTNDWTLETYLLGPGGRKLASGLLTSESEKRRGHAHFRLCRPSAKPGRFTIKARLHWYDGYDDHEAWFQPSHFRLHRAR